MDFHLGAIWAQSRDGIIGDGQQMPWHIPADLRFFKQMTAGHDVLMGRGTWESFPEKFRPLPGRRNVVLSQQPAGAWSQGAEVFAQLPTALNALHTPAWVIGGGQVYQACMPHIDYAVVTEVNVELGGSLGEAAVYAPKLPAAFILEEETEWQECPGQIYSSIVKTSDTVERRVRRYRRSLAK